MASYLHTISNMFLGSAVCLLVSISICLTQLGLMTLGFLPRLFLGEKKKTILRSQSEVLCDDVTPAGLDLGWKQRFNNILKYPPGFVSPSFFVSLDKHVL